LVVAAVVGAAAVVSLGAVVAFGAHAAKRPTVIANMSNNARSLIGLFFLMDHSSSILAAQKSAKRFLLINGLGKQP
jgi:hypothetical protein